VRGERAVLHLCHHIDEFDCEVFFLFLDGNAVMTASRGGFMSFGLLVVMES
jgi:hypothetical protein